MPATITLTCTRRRAALITLVGDVDLATLDRLCVALASASGCADVAVDASGVDFLDCCALRPLLACARAVRAAGGRFRLHDPSPAVVALVAWSLLQDELPTTGAPRRPCATTGAGAARC